ncbi:MAG: hypothetical protein PVG65_06235 [Candidatus Thorarchaeota archaeon]
MKYPVCRFDIESDMLCPNCQDKIERGEITGFDVEFSKWLIAREKEYPALADVQLKRAIRLQNRLILILKKRQKDVFLSAENLIEEIIDKFGELMIFEGAPKLRNLVRMLIAPAVEVGVNSLYLPDGFKESIVMLHSEDREKITYSKEELREIVSAVIGETVIFQYQDEREKEKEAPPDQFDEKMTELSEKS